MSILSGCALAAMEGSSVESVITGFVERIDLEQDTVWIGKIPLRLIEGLSEDIKVGTRVTCTFEDRGGVRWVTSVRRSVFM